MSRPLQDLFDKAFVGLREQGFKRSVNAEGGCVYRGPDNCKCAIGHAIPDPNYRPEMDHKNSVGDGWGVEDFHGAGMFWDIRQKQFDELQRAHDTGYNPVKMERQLREFATTWNLTVPA